MRETLFRGKRKDNGEWARGDLCQHASGAVMITNVKEGANANHEVVPETVGRYIGSADTKGVKIFEGDIVRMIVIGNIHDNPELLAEERVMGYSWGGSFLGLCAGLAARIRSATSGEYMAVVPTMRAGLMPAFLIRTYTVWFLRPSAAAISAMVISSISRKITGFKRVVKKCFNAHKVFLKFFQKTA